MAKAHAQLEPSTLTKFGRAAAEIFVNPTCRNATIAACFRFFGGYAIGFFMPSFFGGIYPEDKNKYSIGNAFVVSLCGFTSAVFGGYLSDRFEN